MPGPMSVFSSSSFKVLGLILRSLMYFELILHKASSGLMLCAGVQSHRAVCERGFPLPRCFQFLVQKQKASHRFVPVSSVPLVHMFLCQCMLFLLLWLCSII